MRTTPLPIAIGVTTLLQVLCYSAEVPAGLSFAVATAVGCATYVVLRMRRPLEDES